MCLLHLNSSICFPIWHVLHHLRHNLKLCSCCHSESSSKSSKEGEAGIVGECRGTDYPVQRWECSSHESCGSTKPNQSSHRKDQTVPEKVDRVQVPIACTGEKSSLFCSLTFVIPETHFLNIKILLTGCGKLKHLPL